MYLLETQRDYVIPVLFLGLLLPVMPASGQGRNKDGVEFPVLSLPNNNAKGPGIMTALGGRLTEVAKWYGHSDEEFRALCRRDRHLKADRQGRLHYVCEGPVPAEGSSSGWGMSGTVLPAPFPDSQTFLLHSKAGASKVIYLDFNGHTTSGTPWNSSYTGGASIVTPAYDISGSPTFTTTELANIQLIWQAVTEAYSPFDVDVTTQDPGIEALRKTSGTDVNYGVRVCIGGSSADWFSASASGVAYLNSFNWPSDTPAFVFPAQLANGDPKYVAETVSHETGHTFGLHHDGQAPGTEYYAGHGNWAPIMGVGYHADVTQFSKGEYANANNFENDLALISSHIPYRVDAAGDDVVFARRLSGSAFNVSGIIEKTADADLYGFSTGAGMISFTAKPAPLSANLNLRLALYDSIGNLVTHVPPTMSSSGATLSTTVPPGTYYLDVSGVGSGDPATTGYSDYGSLGQFTFTGSAAPTTNKPPVAVATKSTPLSGYGPLKVAFSSSGSADPDGILAAYNWDFGNGAGSTAANPIYTYPLPGTYTASLVVVDNGGGSASTKVNVTVKNCIFVSALAMSVNKNSSGSQATAVVTIKDLNGKPIFGAKVNGAWSGLKSSNVSAATNISGQVTFVSSRVNKIGTFTFKVTGLSFSGSYYNSAANQVTQASILTPIL